MIKLNGKNLFVKYKVKKRGIRCLSEFEDSAVRGGLVTRTIKNYNWTKRFKRME